MRIGCLLHTHERDVVNDSRLLSRRDYNYVTNVFFIIVCVVLVYSYTDFHVARVHAILTLFLCPIFFVGMF